MSKARQSKRQRYRKPRADYQSGGRVKYFSGSPGNFNFRGPSKEAIEAAKKAADNKKKKPVATRPAIKTKSNETVGQTTVNVREPELTTQPATLQATNTNNNNNESDEVFVNNLSNNKPTISPANITASLPNLTNTNIVQAQETSGVGETMEGSGDVTKDDQGNNQTSEDSKGSENVSNNQESSSGNQKKPIKKPTDNPITGIIDKEAREARIKKMDEELAKGLKGELPDNAKLSDPSEEDGTKLIYESAKTITGEDPITVAEPATTPDAEEVQAMDDEVVKTVDDVEKADDVTIDPVTGKRREAAQVDLDELAMVDEDADVDAAQLENLSDESTVNIDDVKVKGVDSIDAATVADEFRSDDPEANAALVKEVTGKLSPGAKAEVVKVVGLSERKITRYKKQLRNNYKMDITILRTQLFRNTLQQHLQKCTRFFVHKRVCDKDQT